MEDKSWMFNYEDIFFCYHTEEGKVFDKTIDFHSLIYIHTGELLVNNGKRNVSVKGGECVFLHRNHRVSITKQPNARGENFRGIFLIFRKDFLRNYYKQHPMTDLQKKRISLLPDVVMLNDNPSVKSLFVSMIPYFNANVRPTEEMMHLKMQEGLLALLQTDERFYPCLFDFSQPWKIDLEDFMNHNYMYDLSLEELARFTGRSLAAFKRDFKQVSNMSPQKWMMQKRLEAAYQLICSQNQKVSDVYLKLGFKSLSHFSTAFKQHFGFAPTQSTL